VSLVRQRRSEARASVAAREFVFDAGAL
jgi:hypothetical protein